ncbi:MAG: PAS domain-containing sensor histidine kinase [Desulfonatronovibrio sp. MSAO_Bac4]|nr:MAG: PAS domain-containing sensor histidine kinase [Desulfonatronovibrio sp. MSAO_Bac4]
MPQDRIPGEACTPKDCTDLLECRGILMNAPIGIFTSTPEGRFTTVNNTMADLCGYESPEQMISSVTSIDEQIYDDPCDRQIIKRLLEEQDEIINHECRFQRHDKTRFWVSINARIQRDQDNRIVNYHGFITDITEQKQSQDRLARKEEFLSTVFDSIQDGVSVLDADMRILRVNKKMNEWYSHMLPLEGKKCYQAYHGRSTECRVCPVSRALKTGCLEMDEIPLVQKDGATGTLELYAFPMQDDTGQVTGVVEFVRNISKRKKAEESLHLFVETIENSSDAIGISTPDGKHYYQNQAFTNMFGAIGDDPRQAIFAEQVLATEVFQTIMSGDRWTGEAEMIAKDGEVRTVFLRAYPSKDQDGNVKALVGVHTDITEQKETLKNQNKLQTQLFQAQKMESVGILAGGVAHDFNNLLHTISGNVQLLSMSKPEDHPDSKRLRTIERSIDRAARLVRQLLLFSRKARPKREKIDLNREITETVRILEPTISELVEIKLNLEHNLWPISADKVQMEQIILNLGTNAAEAMSESGTILIETNNVILDSGDLPDMDAGRYVQLTITDTGCGMDNEVLDHVFDPFFTTKEVGQGTGLGLASVYGIVKSHNGYIKCYSEPDKGSVFKIFLPAITDAELDDDRDHPEPALKKGTDQTVE